MYFYIHLYMRFPTINNAINHTIPTAVEKDGV